MTNYNVAFDVVMCVYVAERLGVGWRGLWMNNVISVRKHLRTLDFGTETSSNSSSTHLHKINKKKKDNFLL